MDSWGGVEVWPGAAVRLHGVGWLLLRCSPWYESRTSETDRIRLIPPFQSISNPAQRFPLTSSQPIPDEKQRVRTHREAFLAFQS